MAYVHKPCRIGLSKPVGVGVIHCFNYLFFVASSDGAKVLMMNHDRFII